jgi:hypothetical protein
MTKILVVCLQLAKSQQKPFQEYLTLSQAKKLLFLHTYDFLNHIINRITVEEYFKVIAHIKVLRHTSVNEF